MRWLFENVLGMVLVCLTIQLVHSIFKPFLFKFWERRSGPIAEGADAPDDEYWHED